MAEVTILQHWIVSKFILPFFLIWFVVFAILEKTKLLGENKQINTLVAAVIGLIFVGAIFPKEVVENLILFLSVAIIVVFTALLLWGFVSGDEAKVDGKLKKFAAAGVIIAVAIAVFWAVGLRIEALNKVIDFLFYQPWSATFWTNALFIVVVAAAVTVILLSKSSKKD